MRDKEGGAGRRSDMIESRKEDPMSARLKTALRAALLLTLVITLAGPFSAQNAPTDQNLALVKHLKWRNVGPANMIGRIPAFEGLDSDFTNVLVAGAAGGVFKSVNAGTTWEPIFERYGSSSIGDVKFFQKDPKTIWVGSSRAVTMIALWGPVVRFPGFKSGPSFGRAAVRPTR